MGWLWASSSPAKASTPDKDALPPAATTPSSAPSEAVDPEVQKFLDLFQTDNKPKEDPTASSTSSQQSSSSSSSSESSSGLKSWLSLHASSSNRTITEAPPGDALSEELLPADMSCRQAFDLAWACNGMGGQWNAVYRYGEMRSCSEQWDDFWFCMRTKSYSAEMREKAIKAHYRNKEYAKYGPGKPSSEDIWEGRLEKVAPGSVFTEPID